MKRLLSIRCNPMFALLLGLSLGLSSATQAYAQIKTKYAANYFDAEMLHMAWETDPDAIDRLLPPCFEPYERPIVMAFVADLPKTDFGVSYKMAALFIVCKFEGELGLHCVSMPENDDIPIFLGRESEGFPKKYAEIEIKRNGGKIDASVVRRGIKFLEVHATVKDEFETGENAEIMKQIVPDPKQMDVVAFNVKAFGKAGGGGFAFTPRIVRVGSHMRPVQIDPCDAEVTIRKSKYDSPWSRLSIEKFLGCFYTKGNNHQEAAVVVGEIEAKKYLRYSRIKFDW